MAWVDVSPCPISRILDRGAQLIEAGDGVAAVSCLCRDLEGIRAAVSEETWRTTICSECRSHPIHDLLLQDPYTRRAFEKPRGYAGDAVMMDYIYSGLAPVGTSAIGEIVFQGTTRTANGLSVVERRDRLTAWIDACDETPASRVLSIACGHLREAQTSRALREGTIQEWIAMDQDVESLGTVSRDAISPAVRTIRASARMLVQGKLGLSDLQRIYAAGLFDYLSDRLASKVIETAYKMLAPGGQMLIANFLPESAGRAYMEAFMDWWLIYRSPHQLLRLVPASIQDATTILIDTDSWQNIVYLKIGKGEHS